MDYLTTRPKIPLFVMEVDNYRTGDSSLLVPRAVGVPAWVASRATTLAPTGDPAADEVMRLMDGLASVAWCGDPRVSDGPSVLLDAGRRLRERPPIVARHRNRSRRPREAGHADVALAVRDALRESGLSIRDGVTWPWFRCDAIRNGGARCRPQRFPSSSASAHRPRTPVPTASSHTPQLRSHANASSTASSTSSGVVGPSKSMYHHSMGAFGSSG